MNASTALAANRVAFGSLCGLITLCVFWEWLIAPIRPDGSWMILKALPLMIPLPGIVASGATRRYTYQWTTLFVSLYFTEGIVRAWSDGSALARAMAGVEVLLCTLFFVAAATYIRRTPSHLARVQP